MDSLVTGKDMIPFVSSQETQPTEIMTYLGIGEGSGFDPVARDHEIFDRLVSSKSLCRTKFAKRSWPLKSDFFKPGDSFKKFQPTHHVKKDINTWPEKGPDKFS